MNTSLARLFDALRQLEAQQQAINKLVVALKPYAVRLDQTCGVRLSQGHAEENVKRAVLRSVLADVERAAGCACLVKWVRDDIADFEAVFSLVEIPD